MFMTIDFLSNPAEKCFSVIWKYHLSPSNKIPHPRMRLLVFIRNVQPTFIFSCADDRMIALRSSWLTIPCRLKNCLMWCFSFFSNRQPLCPSCHCPKTLGILRSSFRFQDDPSLMGAITPLLITFIYVDVLLFCGKNIDAYWRAFTVHVLYCTYLCFKYNQSSFWT